MAFRLLTAEEYAAQNLNFLESALGQSAPLQEKAFLRVLAVMQAMGQTGLAKYAANRALQSLALTATGADLNNIGAEFGVDRTLAVSAVVTATITGTTGLTLPAGRLFTGAVNGVSYYVDASVVLSGGVATFTATAGTPGVTGNLQATDILNIVQPIAGIASYATVTALTTTGAEEETDDAYRLRILEAERLTTGGGNNADYKIWAEEVAGVYRAFPYSGKPVSLALTSYPGDRSVFVEADDTIDPDGIPPSSLLDDVRDAINNDPVTGAERPAMGSIDSTLYVEAITREAIDITVTGLTTSPGDLASVKADLEAAFTVYLLLLAPFISGVTLPQDRNDLITALTLSEIAQGVLAGWSASATQVQFELASGGGFLTSYQLGQGELVKFGTPTYV